ncbi:hypothetical protein, partial [Escherichia coli]|uniref:hypothetical protein n=1 Tax=Escherichia coli TaxID=562 RepID=UPI003891D1DE
MNFRDTSFKASHLQLSTSQNWILDTGASTHMTGCKHDFEKLQNIDGRTVTIANNTHVPVAG